ncbi:MAG TPA: DnaD domain protein [Clostridiaceae bacterium]|jgi:DnaD/phage-associated family protein|nr:DnaD domain protein [Clostridia bacterium]MBP8633599.1 DnaD domain protein [Clostridia bacterium]MED9924341.1 DnaD domain protein [Clostridia bacterium]CDC06685.1 primosome DnaD subunit [Clostridium sp. CAG:343]HJJ17824.1 DnaD domain protein [Clostridiaceae bacterium]
MKLEQNEKPLLFSETIIPDIFFSEHLSELPGDYLKIYLYMIFLSKYGKDIKLTDLSKKLNIPLKAINDGMKFLEEHHLITKKTTGYIIIDLQEATLHNLYTPNLTMSKEKIEQTSKNKSKSKAIEHINNTYFQGIMGPSWYNDIDIWFRKYCFDEQVMIALFDYCYKRSALHRNYVQTVAEAWASNKVKTWNDLDTYYQQQESLNKIKKSIAKKLGKYNGLTQYEEAYIENWILNFGYDMNIIEIALKRTTFKQNPTFEYINNIITDWHDRNLKTPSEITAFIEQRKKQDKDTKALKTTVNKANYEQRKYSNLDFLYANNIEKKGN